MEEFCILAKTGYTPTSQKGELSANWALVETSENNTNESEQQQWRNKRKRQSRS